MDVIAGAVGDMSKLGIYEAFKVSLSVPAQGLHLITGQAPEADSCVCCQAQMCTLMHQRALAWHILLELTSKGRRP